MARNFPVADEDVLLLRRIVGRLREERLAQGLSVVQLEGGSKASPNPRVSTFQGWAHDLGCRLEFGVDHFWLHSWSDQEMLALYAMSRSWGSHEFARMWLVSALGLWRRRMNISNEEMAAALGVTTGAVVRWEWDANDPPILKVLAHARAAGTRVTLRLWRKEDWHFV